VAVPDDGRPVDNTRRNAMTARPVLAGTDGSPISLAAVHWAAEEALRRGTALRLVHVWPQPVGIHLEQLQAEGAALLTQVREQVAGRYPALEVETALVGASPVEGLLDAAADGELLVLGTRGLGGFTGLVVGSVSLAAAARSPIPVVVLRPGPVSPQNRAADHARDIVVGVGAGGAADEVLDFAFSRAQEHGARVIAVHAWGMPVIWAPPGMILAPGDATTTELESAAQAYLTLALSPWRAKYPQVKVVSRTSTGGAAKALVDAPEGAELVVVGHRIRKHSAGGHLGFAAHAVLHHAHAPVAVVPHH
jgi:nucleotide-binding universal stress UspA family protein